MTAIRCGEPGDDLHVVLDHQHRLALLGVHGADQLDELRHVLDRDARHRLVEQDHARVAREHHRELELALVAVRRASRRARRPRPPSPTRSSAQSRPLDAPRARARRAARSASSRRAPPRPRAARSRARAAAGRRSTPGRCARARARVRRNGGCAGDVDAVELDARRSSARSRPERRLKSDVLPAPFGPITPSNSPSRTSSPTSATMVAPPMSSPRSCVARIGDALTRRVAVAC